MAFTVYVDDNFHYMDESERYEKGVYDTEAEAIEVAKEIVDDFLFANEGKFDDAEALHEHYRTFGEDPFIRGEKDPREFSAWSYARERCDQIYAAGDTAECDKPDDTEYDFFPFRRDEQWFANTLRKFVRSLVVRESDSASRLRKLSPVVFAVNRLPAITRGLNVNLSIAYRSSGECSSCELEISEDRLALSTGGNAYDPELGSDSFAETIIEMESTGFRDRPDDPCEVQAWFEGARELLEMGAEIEVVDYEGTEMVDWNDTIENPWELYERSGELDDDWD